MTFERKSSYTFEELLECGHGHLFGNGNAQLPLPPLMLSIVLLRLRPKVSYGKGEIMAELDINPDLWFFKCHFENDPVMPGCLGLDAMWQLVGFFLGWLGGWAGAARLASEKLFTGQVLDTAKKLTYQINIKRVIMRKLVMGIADGVMNVDGTPIYEAKDIRVGLFTPSEQS